jgi:hypothetical protein
MTELEQEREKLVAKILAEEPDRRDDHMLRAIVALIMPEPREVDPEIHALLERLVQRLPPSPK